jgi:peptide subunit release factor 1 (eRF1)
MPVLKPLIDRLAAYEPSDHPVVSLFLNLQPDQHGRDNFETFVRKEFKERLKSYADASEQRGSLEQDFERIRSFLEQDVNRSADGLAIFACGPRDLFEVVQLDAPIAEHRLYVDALPHLYPLARLDDQYPRYAALLLDTSSARLFVFGAGAVERAETLQSGKTRRTQAGGWSQARYQRHTDNLRQQHVREAVDMLARVVREEDIPKIVLAGDDVAIPLVRDELAADLAAKIVDVARLDQKAPEHEILAATLESLREHDARDDRERVQRLFDAHRAGGLGVVGPEETKAALELGQVDELLITAYLDGGNGTGASPNGDGQALASSNDRTTATLSGGERTSAAAEATNSGSGGERQPEVSVGDHGAALPEQAAEELVTRAAQTAARVTFIEDPSLLGGVGGVGALLRFRI